MKVGILTFHRGPNYGGFLQAWSLREAIRGLGHEVEIINYKNRRHFEEERFRLRPTLRMGRAVEQWKRSRMWERAYQELALGNPVHDPSRISWDRYDAIVVGSDIVWDHETPKFGNDGVYFGRVPGKGPGRWIGYAPSCGKASLDRLSRDKMEGLRQFTHIGARDEGTRQLVRETVARETSLVVDPTWLFDGEARISLEETDPILAIYGYAKMSPEMVESIRSFARRHGLETVAYGYRKAWADRNVFDVSPFDWVEALRRARCIVTGTFHGTLYALRLGKIFGVVGNEWIANKIAAPLAIVDAKERLVNCGADLTRQLEEQFSSKEVESLYNAVQQPREESLAFLRNALA